MGSAMILPKDRDPRFITIRRGGTLTDSNHHLLALWAAACAEHVLHLFESALTLQTCDLARRSRRLGHGCVVTSRCPKRVRLRATPTRQLES